jgi:uncharacterized membrane protein YfcA
VCLVRQRGGVRAQLSLGAALTAWLAQSPLLLGYVALCVLAGFLVRGYSGFGSSLVAVSALVLVLPPARIVPAIFGLELLASLSLLPSVRRDVNWSSLTWIVAGCMVATPLGVVILAHAPLTVMRIGISVVVMAAAAVLLRGFALSRSPGAIVTFLVGALSGVLNGSTGMGGPPAVVFYFSSREAVAVGRATIIAYLFFTESYALVLAAAAGLLDARMLVLMAYGVPFVVLGIWLGHRRFIATDPATFRRVVLWLLLGLGVAGVVTTILRG